MVFNQKQLPAMLQAWDVQTPEDLQQLLGTMTTEVLQAVYDGELTAHLGYAKHHPSANRNSSRNTRQILRGWKHRSSVCMPKG